MKGMKHMKDGLSKSMLIFMSFMLVMVQRPDAVLQQKPPAPRKDPTVAELLAAAGTYIAQYEQQFAAIVSEERYQQDANALAGGGGSRRILRSDVLMLSAGSLGWVGLRDVYEVDGLPVRDHVDRLMKLITQPSPDSFEQARRLADESARYNLGAIARTINTPTIALVFVRRENQPRSTFTFDGMKTVDGVRAAQLSFQEQKLPRVIVSVDDAAAKGKFWIVPASGRIVRTELSIESVGYTAKIGVRYANQPKLGLWVPVRIDEEYETVTSLSSVVNRVVPPNSICSITRSR